MPQALTDYIKGRQGYDYAEHGRAGNTHTDFVPDEIVDRFCVLGPVEAHLEKLRALRELGVDQFAVYLQHDDKEDTLAGVRRDRSSRRVRGDAVRRQRSVAPWRRRGRLAVGALGAVVLAALIWEGYKAVGNPDGTVVLGVRVLPRADDAAMPHVGTILSPLRPTPSSPAATRLAGGARRRACSRSRSVAVGLRGRRDRRAAAGGAHAAAADRRARAAAVRDPLPDRAADRARAADRRLGRAAVARARTRGSPGCRSP